MRDKLTELIIGAAIKVAGCSNGADFIVLEGSKIKACFTIKFW